MFVRLGEVEMKPQRTMGMKLSAGDFCLRTRIKAYLYGKGKYHSSRRDLLDRKLISVYVLLYNTKQSVFKDKIKQINKDYMF